MCCESHNLKKSCGIPSHQTNLVILVVSLGKNILGNC
jgi:hypothetical protein